MADVVDFRLYLEYNTVGDSDKLIAVERRVGVVISPVNVSKKQWEKQTYERQLAIFLFFFTASPPPSFFFSAKKQVFFFVCVYEKLMFVFAPQNTFLCSSVLLILLFFYLASSQSGNNSALVFTKLGVARCGMALLLRYR